MTAVVVGIKPLLKDLVRGLVAGGSSSGGGGGPNPTLPNASTLTLAEQSVSAPSDDTRSIAWNSDGTVFFIANDDDLIIPVAAPSPYSVAVTASDQGTPFNAGYAVTARPLDVLFNNDGTKMYVPCYNISSVYQFDLSASPYQPTAGMTPEYTLSESNIVSMHWGNNGSEVYLCTTADLIKHGTCSTPYDLSTVGAFTDTNVISGIGISGALLTWPHGVILSSDGTRLWITGPGTGERIFQSTLSTPWDVSTATYDGGSTDLDMTGVAGMTDVYGASVDGVNNAVYVCSRATPLISKFTW